MNDRFAVVQINSRVAIMTTTVDELLGGRRMVYSFLKRQEFALLLANQFTGQMGQSGKWELKPKSEMWLKHPGRLEYSGWGVYPPPMPIPEGHFNAWHGFGIVPAKGEWSRLRTHIEDVICRGDRISFEYVLNWSAWSVQHPAQKIETAILLIGGPKTGKGTFGHIFRRIWGQHATYITRKDQLFGRFNAPLADALFAFADEALYAGDPSILGQIKSLLTEPVMIIERKFLDPILVPNRLRVILASNEAHALHLDRDDRRIAVFETVDIWGREADAKRDHFDALHRELNNGGLEAFLYDMLDRDVSNWDQWAIPITRARTN
jgi:hypothetical protein